MLLIKAKQYVSKDNISRIKLTPVNSADEDQVQLLEKVLLYSNSYYFKLQGLTDYYKVTLDVLDRSQWTGLYWPTDFSKGSFSGSNQGYLVLVVSVEQLFKDIFYFQSSHQPGQEINYGELVQIGFGPRGKNVVDAAICASQLGFCCAYLIFISENIAHFYHGLEEGEERVLIISLIYIDDINGCKTHEKKATEKMKLPVLACMIPGLVALSLIRKLHKLSIFK